MSAPGLWGCGTLGKAHGLHGELYLNLSPRGLDYLELGTRFYLTDEGAGEARPCEVTRVGGDDRRPLVLLDLAGDREAAIGLQGRELFAAGEELDALPHYLVGELVGRRVETPAGRHLGEVGQVLEAPAHEILEVRAPDGTVFLVPLVEQLVTVDQEAGVVRVAEEGLEGV